jgi:flagellar basal-body rod protein FlgF
MDRALYVGMTGASQIMQAQAVVAQNLANVSTNGFRADMYAFAPTPIAGPGYPTRVNAVAQSNGFSTSTGAISQTGATLDVAVMGDGWLAVQAKDGTEAYTRAGDLHMTPDGSLVTATGRDGTVTVVPQGVGAKGAGPVGRLKLVNPPAAQLVKGADGMVRLKDGTTAPSDANVQVKSGSLETSNVNAPRAMVEMIELSRLFDMQTKLMSSTDQNAQASQKLLAPN